MKLYLRLLAVLTFIALLIDCLFIMPVYKISLSVYLKIYFYYIIYIVVIDILVSLVVRVLPHRIYNVQNIYFKERKFEKNLYNKIKVNKWKNKIPEFGKLSGFKKDKIVNFNDNNYLNKFVLETCYAELIHSISLILGLLFIFNSLECSFLILLPLMMWHTIIHFLPICIQRSIRPRLLKVIARNNRVFLIHRYGFENCFETSIFEINEEESKTSESKNE